MVGLAVVHPAMITQIAPAVPAALPSIVVGLRLALSLSLVLAVVAVGAMLAFATYALGFLARPLGGVVFGHFGDKFGRKRALVTALISNPPVDILPREWITA